MTKTWCMKVRSGCRGAVYTNLEVNTVFRTIPHAETCAADDSLLYKIEKETLLNAAQGKKQSCCLKYTRKNAQVHPPAWKLLKPGQTVSPTASNTLGAGNSSTLAYENIWKLAGHSVWMEHFKLFLNGTSRCSPFTSLKKPQTVICYFETVLIPAVQGSFPGVNIQGCYFHFCLAVLRKVAELRLKTSTGCRGTAWQKCYGSNCSIV
ncbi:hypothetical protein T4B_7371 [Trichinella pseudospiralis]|uniref:MULE transposase domain-containing protein n=1 Tax=Trichinella pseudospiralis TaxID=6337 RepID=A0A0V1JWC5_TRIPS|nr:hypothetical protein T4B_7371 [Trichinella pseudospiralis]KRZ39282.1 hypothetical protein T4C_7260 [Trichinella pseudospiralis]